MQETPAKTPAEMPVDPSADAAAFLPEKLQTVSWQAFAAYVERSENAVTSLRGGRVDEALAWLHARDVAFRNLQAMDALQNFLCTRLEPAKTPTEAGLLERCNVANAELTTLLSEHHARERQRLVRAAKQRQSLGAYRASILGGKAEGSSF